MDSVGIDDIFLQEGKPVEDTMKLFIKGTELLQNRYAISRDSL